MKPFPRKQRRPAEKQTKVSRTDPQMARDGKPKASSISITAPCTVGSASSASPLKAANVHDSIIDLGRLDRQRHRFGFDAAAVRLNAGEPSTWAMMIVDFLGQGWFAYRRRKGGPIRLRLIAWPIRRQRRPTSGGLLLYRWSTTKSEIASLRPLNRWPALRALAMMTYPILKLNDRCRPTRGVRLT